MSRSGSAREGTLPDVVEAIREQEAGERIQQLAVLGTLVAETAHELNNVLCYVSHNLDVARKRVEQRNYAELENVLRDASDGVAELVELARVLRRVEVAEPALLDVRDVLESTVRMVRPRLGRRAVLERDYHEVPRVRAVESQLRQALLNLLLNAVEAFDTDDPERNRIRLVVRTGACGSAIIEVNDTGRGIGAHDLERIFDPFYTTKQGGSGLGLALCKRVIDRVGGTMMVETSSAGTSLVVTVPSAGSSGEWSR